MPNPDGTPTQQELEQLKQKYVAGITTPTATQPEPTMTFEAEKVGSDSLRQVSPTQMAATDGLDSLVKEELASRYQLAQRSVQDQGISHQKRAELAKKYDLPAPSKPKPQKAQRPASSLDLLRQQVTTTAQERDSALDQKESAVAQQLEADKKLADTTVALRQQQSQEMSLVERDRLKRDADRNAELDRRMKLIEDETNKPIDEKIDPERTRKSQSTGGKVADVIGLLLSGMGSGLSGQENMAMKVINKRVDDDIAAQRDNIANAKDERQKKLASRFTLFGQYRSKFDDERQAELMTRDTLLHKHQQDLQNLADQHKSDSIGAKASEAAAGIAEQRTQIQQDLRNGIIQTTQISEKQAAAAAAARAKAAQEAAWAKAGVVKAPDGKLYTQDPTGQFVPLTEAAAHDVATGKLMLDKEKAAAKTAAGDKLSFQQRNRIDSAGIAKGAIKEFGQALGMTRDPKTGQWSAPSWGNVAKGKVPFTDVNNKLHALQETLISEVGKAQTGGALAQGTAEEMKEQIKGIVTPGRAQEFMNHYYHTMENAEMVARKNAGTIHNVGENARLSDDSHEDADEVDPDEVAGN